ncbi:hypothetical protein B0E48_05610 [Rhodanobacter sp. C03]|nr:hypothetical protein B0E48_05610 [Rhodanobacter sp. C03]
MGGARHVREGFVDACLIRVSGGVMQRGHPHIAIVRIDAAHAGLPTQHLATGLCTALDHIKQPDIRGLGCDDGSAVQQAQRFFRTIRKILRKPGSGDQSIGIRLRRECFNGADPPRG